MVGLKALHSLATDSLVPTYQYHRWNTNITEQEKFSRILPIMLVISRMHTPGCWMKAKNNHIFITVRFFKLHSMYSGKLPAQGTPS